MRNSTVIVVPKELRVAPPRPAYTDQELLEAFTHAIDSQYLFAKDENHIYVMYSTVTEHTLSHKSMRGLLDLYAKERIEAQAIFKS